MTAVILDQLSKRFGTNLAIQDISVSIRDGEFISLLGPSGCGKSTTLRMIAGFERCDGGRILFDGTDVAPLPPERRDIGMVFQSYALFPHLTVAGNLAFGLEVRKMPRSEIRTRVADALATVRLEGLADRYPRALSGGQQQRVALARALVIEPRILLLDEPLANLDAKLRDEMRVFITELQRRVGITTIYVTHDQAEAMTMSDRIAVMFGGKILQFDTPAEIYDRPASLEVANFIGQPNVLSAHVALDGNDRVVHTVLGTRPLDHEATAVPGDSVFVMLRPEALRLAPADDATSATGTIEAVQFSGSFTTYRLGLPDGESIQVQEVGPARHFAGDVVAIWMPPAPLWPIGSRL